MKVHSAAAGSTARQVLHPVGRSMLSLLGSRANLSGVVMAHHRAIGFVL
jgi:hypothetical protein